MSSSAPLNMDESASLLSQALAVKLRPKGKAAFEILHHAASERQSKHVQQQRAQEDAALRVTHHGVSQLALRRLRPRSNCLLASIFSPCLVCSLDDRTTLVASVHFSLGAGGHVRQRRSAHSRQT